MEIEITEKEILKAESDTHEQASSIIDAIKNNANDIHCLLSCVSVSDDALDNMKQSIIHAEDNGRIIKEIRKLADSFDSTNQLNDSMNELIKLSARHTAQLAIINKAIELLNKGK